jgi:hypothetical protein
MNGFMTIAVKAEEPGQYPIATQHPGFLRNR